MPIIQVPLMYDKRKFKNDIKGTELGNRHIERIVFAHLVSTKSNYENSPYNSNASYLANKNHSEYTKMLMRQSGAFPSEGPMRTSR